MNTCANCKHFKEKTAFSGECTSNKFHIGYHSVFGEYGSEKKKEEHYEYIPPDSVMVEGDEGWGFKVGKDFGCIHWTDLI